MEEIKSKGKLFHEQIDMWIQFKVMQVVSIPLQPHQHTTIWNIRSSEMIRLKVNTRSKLNTRSKVNTVKSSNTFNHINLISHGKRRKLIEWNQVIHTSKCWWSIKNHRIAHIWHVNYILKVMTSTWPCFIYLYIIVWDTAFVGHKNIAF